MKSIAILLLLGEISAHQYITDNDMVQLDIQQGMEQGLGSLEGAYLAQKQLMKEKAFKWDDSVLGVVDANTYVAAQKDALEEQQVDIEFAQKPIKEESWRDAPVSAPATSLAQKVAHKTVKAVDAPVSAPATSLAQKVAHKTVKAVDAPVEISNSEGVERSNIAQIASKFEEESREFEA
jgi:hypothetical protein